MFSLALLISAMVIHPINQNASCLLPCQRQNIHNIQQILDVYILHQGSSDHALCTTRGSFCSSRKRNWAVWTQSHITLQRWEQADIWGEVPCEDKELDRNLCFPNILDWQHFCTLVEAQHGFGPWGKLVSQPGASRAMQEPCNDHRQGHMENEDNFKDNWLHKHGWKTPGIFLTVYGKKKKGGQKQNQIRPKYQETPMYTCVCKYFYALAFSTSPNSQPDSNSPSKTSQSFFSPLPHTLMLMKNFHCFPPSQKS